MMSGKRISLQKHDCIFPLHNDIDLPRFEYAGLIIGTGSIQSHIGEVVALTPKVDVISSLVIPRYSSRVGPIFLNTTKTLPFRKILRKTFIQNFSVEINFYFYFLNPSLKLISIQPIFLFVFDTKNFIEKN